MPVQNVPLDPFQPNPDPSRLITFRVGEAVYALPLRYVREVVSYEAPALLQAPVESYEEVIYLRGALIPVLHLRRLIAQNPAATPVSGFIIILRFEFRHVGLVVDSVDQLFTPERSEVHPSNDAFAKHLLEADGARIRLLDLEKVIPAVYLLGPPPGGISSS